jgi:hypothetical protein
VGESSNEHRDVGLGEFAPGDGKHHPGEVIFGSIAFTLSRAALKAEPRAGSFTGARISTCPSVEMLNWVSASAPISSRTGFSI